MIFYHQVGLTCCVFPSQKNSCRTTHKRKQDHPSTQRLLVCMQNKHTSACHNVCLLVCLLFTGRTADKKEHENLFERRKRDWKRVRSGEMRMFTTEPLHGTQPRHLVSPRSAQ